MAGRTVGFAASFFIPVVLVRLLDQSDFGTYKQIFLVAGTLYGVGQLGMAESLFYFLPRSPAARARFVANSVLALILGGLGCLAFLMLGGDTVSRWLSNGALSRYAPALGLYLLLMLASAALEIVMVSLKRYRLAAGSYVALDVVRMGLLVVPVLLVQRLEWLLAGAVVFAALRCAVTFWYLRWEFRPDLRPDAALLRQQLAYAVPFQLSGIVEIFQGNMHQYAVSHYFDAATFAIYSVGCLQIPLVDFVASSVCNVMMVRMAEEIRDDHPRAATAVWRDTTRRLALIFVPVFGFLLVGAHAIITLLFTESYAASVPVFMVSSLAVLFATLQVDGVLRVYAETRLLVALNGLKLVLILASIGWAVATLHLVGAIAVTVFASVVMKGLGLLRLRTLMGVGLGDILPWRSLGTIVVVGAGAALAAFGVGALVDAGPFGTLVLTGCVYGAVYLAGLYGLGALTEAERRAAREWLGRHGSMRAAVRSRVAGGQ